MKFGYYQNNDEQWHWCITNAGKELCASPPFSTKAAAVQAAANFKRNKMPATATQADMPTTEQFEALGVKP